MSAKEEKLLEELIGCYQDIQASLAEIKERLEAIEKKQPRSTMEFDGQGRLKSFHTSALDEDSGGEKAA